MRFEFVTGKAPDPLTLRRRKREAERKEKRGAHMGEEEERYEEGMASLRWCVVFWGVGWDICGLGVWNRTPLSFS